jgi:capsular polysaccharide biosynthesis protein
MDNKGVRLDLFDIISIINKSKKFILLLAVAATIIAAIVLFFMKNQYKAYGVFYPASAVMSGRINLFRDMNQEWIDYFGSENEVDRAYVIGNSAPTISHLIKKFDIAKHYNIDVTTDPKGHQKVYKTFTKNFLLNRTGFKNLEVSFKDEDDKLASEVVNEAMYEVEDNIKSFYVKTNIAFSEALKTKIKIFDSTLVVVTDSMIKTRIEYDIYDILSPIRNNVSNFTPKGRGEKYARGMELIQNLEAVKDKLVFDRLKYVSLSEEFKTSATKAIPSIHVVQWATSGGPKAGPFRTLGVIITFLITLLAGAVTAVVIDTFNKNKLQRAI